LKYAIAFAGLIVVLAVVNKFIIPFKKIELWGVYKIYLLGSGMDDGAVDYFSSHKQRYKKIVLEMLDNSTVDSFNANASFLFGELLLDDADVELKITELSKSHPEREIRCFWHDVLNGRYETVKVDMGSENVAVYRVKDNGSSCE
jgi:hypothetical protein